MKKSFKSILLLAQAAVFILSFVLALKLNNSVRHEEEGPPDDWFIRQRAFPFDDVPYDVRAKSLSQYRTLWLSKKLISSSTWTLVGPSNIGGRVTALALHPHSDSVIIAGTADGGVWESTDFGSTWKVIFEETQSIGALAIDQTHPDTIYIGTGEANSLRSAYAGDGIWKTTNGGISWNHIGLDSTRHIGGIAIDPINTNNIYVAAQGGLRMKNPQRGVYMSTDGGSSWQLSLFLSDSAGATDIIIDPTNPHKLIAATWERFRRENYQNYGGLQSGLWMTTNSGSVWAPISGGFPINDPTLGRVALTICESQPQIIYALAAYSDGLTRGVWKSTDGGFHWTQVYTGVYSSSYAWFNRSIAVDPNNPDVVYAGGIQAEKTSNGGITWNYTFQYSHVDHHAWVISKRNPQIIINGSDGGVYISTSGGSDFTKCYNLPITQFYTGTIDASNPNRYYGGTQDNGTVRTLTGNVNDWSQIYDCDGFYVLVDPQNPNRMYVESQYGVQGCGLGYSLDGGYSFYDGSAGIDGTDRFNWSTPFAMDLNHTLTLYIGSQRVYKTVNGMQDWFPISSDLTRGPNGLMGTITTIDVAKSNSNVIYVGTDDAKVWVTTNGGTAWQDITGTLPMRWVTRVAADPETARVAYVTLSGYKIDSLGSHIYKTTNFGQTWQSISGNLFDIPINDVIVHPFDRLTLAIATDVGVFTTTNGGVQWDILGNGLPVVPVHDLTLDRATGKLTAATHGRSQYVVNWINPKLSLRNYS